MFSYIASFRSSDQTEPVTMDKQQEHSPAHPTDLPHAKGKPDCEEEQEQEHEENHCRKFEIAADDHNPDRFWDEEAAGASTIVDDDSEVPSTLITNTSPPFQFGRKTQIKGVLGKPNMKKPRSQQGLTKDKVDAQEKEEQRYLETTENSTEQQQEEEEEGCGDPLIDANVVGVNKRQEKSFRNGKKKFHHHVQGEDTSSMFGKDVSKCEIFAVALIAIFIASVVIATTLSVVVVRRGDNRSNSDNDRDIAPKTSPPVVSEPRSRTLSRVEQFAIIRSTLSRNPVTANYAREVPYAFEYLEEEDQADTRNPPAVRALSWLVYKDDVDTEDEIVARYALAVLYYSMDGPNWTNKDGWLSNQRLCSSSDGKGNWFGIVCSRSSQGTASWRVAEIDLGENNLSGEISRSICLIESLQILWFDRNAITGSIEPALFPSMKNLQFLYLQHNQLTGPIPNTFLENGNKLRTFFLHGNNFSGSFPSEYCPACDICESPLIEFGVDCKSNKCPTENCCDEILNCH